MMRWFNLRLQTERVVISQRSPLQHINVYSPDSPGTLQRMRNMKNGTSAILFSVNMGTQLAKLIQVPQNHKPQPCLGSFQQQTVFREELIRLDSTLITYIACRKKMALQAIRCETIILF